MKFSELLGLFKEGKATAKSHMKNLIEMAMADGHFDDIEYELLKKIAKNNNIGLKQIEEIKQSLEKIPFELPLDESEKFTQFYDLVHMMVVDEYIDDQEMKLCFLFAKKFGYEESKSAELISSVRHNIDAGNSYDSTMERVQWLIS